MFRQFFYIFDMFCDYGTHTLFSLGRHLGSLGCVKQSVAVEYAICNSFFNHVASVVPRCSLSGNIDRQIKYINQARPRQIKYINQPSIKVL